MAELSINPEKVCFIVMRARAYEAKEEADDLGEGSNPSDQGLEDEVPYLDTLDDEEGGDATEEELRDAIRALNEEERLDLIALMRLGRDDGDLDDWDEIVAEVADEQTTPAEDYLLGTPLLAEYREQGLHKFGISCTDLMPSGTWPDAVAPAKETR